MRLLILFSIMLMSSLAICQVEKSDYFLRGTTSVSGSSVSGIIEGENLIVQQSIGQASIIGAAHSSEATAFQGFIQPNLLDKILTPNVPLILEANIYPNPFITQLFLELDILPKTNVDVNVYDISGSMVWSSSYAKTNYVVIEPQNLTNGYYFLKVECDGMQRVEKILKNK